MCFPRISFSFKKAKRRGHEPDVQPLEILESGATIGEQAVLPASESGPEPLPTGNESPPAPSQAANDPPSIETIEDEPEAPDPGRGAWQTAKTAAITALSLAEKILDGLPVPGAKGTVGAVLLIIQKINVRVLSLCILSAFTQTKYADPPPFLGSQRKCGNT